MVKRFNPANFIARPPVRDEGRTRNAISSAPIPTYEAHDIVASQVHPHKSRCSKTRSDIACSAKGGERVMLVMVVMLVMGGGCWMLRTSIIQDENSIPIVTDYWLATQNREVVSESLRNATSFSTLTGNPALK